MNLRKNNDSYKILNSENNVKVIDGKNINGYKNSKSIGLNKKKYIINQINNDIEKIIQEKKNSQKQVNLYNLNKYDLGVNDKNFLKILHERKKRMLYMGKV